MQLAGLFFGDFQFQMVLLFFLFCSTLLMYNGVIHLNNTDVDVS